MSVPINRYIKLGKYLKIVVLEKYLATHKCLVFNTKNEVISGDIEHSIDLIVGLKDGKYRVLKNKPTKKNIKLWNTQYDTLKLLYK